MKIISGYFPLEKALITEVSKKIKFNLPEKYTSLLEDNKIDGGRPEKYEFVVRLPNGRNFISCMGGFSFFSPEIKSNIFNKYLVKPEAFPDYVLIFADTGFGDYICFDYRNDPQTNNPPVVYWAHEFTDTNEGIVPLAKDFESFLEILMSEEEADQKLKELS
jgi:hypothetical protein